MDRYDRMNLNFLISASAEELRLWYQSAGPDDHMYASKLLATYSEELVVSVILLKDTPIEDLTLAKQVLAPYCTRS